jgi:tRNA (cytidine/uridine-2'-O-)-methyltransferase
LIRPLGFTLDDKRLRRAGLDYREYAEVAEYDNLSACLSHLDQPRLLAISTRGSIDHTQHHYADQDAILFGPETRGLPVEVLDSLPTQHVLRIPMQPESRSLNLSNAAAIVVYEAWRQLGFK